MGIASIFLVVSIQFHLPPGLLSAICYVESKHNASAIHYDDGTANSLGVCQLQLPTARMLGFNGNEKLLFDPNINVWYAGSYLSHLLNRYDGDTLKAVSAYNAGTYTTKNLNYVRKVTVAWKQKK